MTVGTGAIGVTADGQVQIYVPPNVVVVDPPPSGPIIEIGAEQTIDDAEQLPLGNWVVVSGTLVADGAVVVQPITIVDAASRAAAKKKP